MLRFGKKNTKYQFPHLLPRDSPYSELIIIKYCISLSGQSLRKSASPLLRARLQARARVNYVGIYLK